MLKNKNLIAVFFILLVCIVASCVHEIPAPIADGGGNPGDTTGGNNVHGCSADSVYFEQQVLPLLNTTCGKSGCHGTSAPREFQLIFSSASQSYQAIANRFPTNTALARALNEMGEQDVTGYVSPTSDQLAVLQKWIAQGLKHNSCNSCDTSKYAYQANVSVIIKSYCAGCHPAPGSQSIPNLSSITAIQSELQSNPGRLMGSVNWTAPYNTSTSRMPQNGSQLSECERTVIRKWIQGGALNN